MYWTMRVKYFFGVRVYNICVSNIECRKQPVNQTKYLINKKQTTMRKLKLLVQISVDGYFAGPNGEMDWMTWNGDDKLEDYIAKTWFAGREPRQGING